MSYKHGFILTAAALGFACQLQYCSGECIPTGSNCRSFNGVNKCCSGGACRLLANGQGRCTIDTVGNNQWTAAEGWTNPHGVCTKTGSKCNVQSDNCCSGRCVPAGKGETRCSGKPPVPTGNCVQNGAACRKELTKECCSDICRDTVNGPRCARAVGR